jgi:hypothetical protein
MSKKIKFVTEQECIEWAKKHNITSAIQHIGKANRHKSIPKHPVIAYDNKRFWQTVCKKAK